MVRDVLKDRNARLLFTGQSLSMFGSMAMLVVLGIWAKTLTGSSGIAGAVYAALTAPSLCVFLLGPVIDRFPRRTVMIVTDLAMAVAISGLLAVNGRGQLWLIFLAAVAYGTSLGVFAGARAGLLQEALPDEQLGTANGVLTTVNQSLRLVAPLAGAALFIGAGARAVIILDVLTFVASAGATFLIRVQPSPVEVESTHYLRDAASGTRHLLQNPILQSATIVTAVCMLSVGMGEALIFAIVDDGLNQPPAFIAVLGAAQGAGALAAGAALTVVIRRTGELKPIMPGLLALSAGAGILMIPTVGAALAGSVLFGAGIPVVMICLTTLIQRRTEPRAQGRVFTAFELFAGAPQLLSILFGSIAVTVIPFRILLAAMAIGFFAASVYSAYTLRPGRDVLLPADTQIAEAERTPHR